MKPLARVEDFFDLSHHSVVIMRFLSKDGHIREKEKIQLRTPGGKVMDTHVVAIARVKPMLLGPPPDPYVIGVSLPPEITKQDAPPGTEIWNFRDEVRS